MSTASPVYVFGEFRIDIPRNTLWRGSESVRLPSRAFDALAYLIEHRNRLVPKDELISAVWHEVVVTDDSLVHAISVLRHALDDSPVQPKYVRTIPRRGYRFVAEARAVDDGEAGQDANAAEHEAAAGMPPYKLGKSAGMTAERSLLPRFAVLAGVGAVIIATAIVILSQQPVSVTETRSVRLFQPPPEGTSIVSGGILSPDGRYLLFAARGDENHRSELWVRTLNSAALARIDGTEGASKPFWAPDGRRIGFFADGNLMTAALDGEPPRAIAEVGLAPAGGSWGDDDTILYANWSSGVYSVPAGGGDVTEVVALDRSAQDIALAWPNFLPGGRRFLYQVVSLDPARTGSYVGGIGSSESIRVLDTASPAVFAAPGYLLHVRRDMLIAEEFDLRTLELTGRATLLARGVSPPSLSDDNVVSAVDGLVAFQHQMKERNLIWLDRSGETLSTISAPMALFNPRVSPDGSRLLATGSVTSDPGLWLASLERTEFQRLAADAIAPLWAPEDGRVAYTARGGFDLHISNLYADSDAEPLVKDDSVKFLNDWTPDGAHIIYTRLDEQSGLDLWRLGVQDGVDAPLLATPFNEMQARISPDGRWLAYVSDATGTAEVYVAPYPGMGLSHLASDGGGGQPQWRADQEELFYLAPDRSIVAVELTSTAETISFGAPQRLFRAPAGGDLEDARDHYAVAANGTKFLVDGAISHDDATAITVIVSWGAQSSGRSGGSDPAIELVSRAVR